MNIFTATLAFFQTVTLSSSSDPLEPFEILYYSGIEALYRSDFKNAINCMHKALRSFSELRNNDVQCRLKCQDQHPLVATAMDFQFFGSVLRRSSCLNACLERKLGSQTTQKWSEEAVQEFNERLPYRILKRVYSQMNQPDTPGAAAQTHSRANPEHGWTRQSPSLDGEEGRDFGASEVPPHQKAFVAGVKLHSQGQYLGAVEHFEKALEEYSRADAECRAWCEAARKPHGDLVQRLSLAEVISDHYIRVLLCKHDCVRHLSTLLGHHTPLDNYLPLHYDYLQFAYFKLNRIQEAVECAQAYLLFHQGDSAMTKNLEYYTGLLGHQIKPREQAAWYVRRHRLEQDLLLISSENRGVEQRGENYWSQLGRRQDVKSIPSGPDGSMEHVSEPEEKVTRKLRQRGPLLYDGVRLVRNSEGLNGTGRVLLDDVITEEDCSELKTLANTVSTAGDGYKGNTSPHTPSEKFEGATVLKTFQSSYKGLIPVKSARLFYDLCEKVRRIMESYFMLGPTLHFSFTHLVCRTALTGQQENRTDLSHPIHADNCVLDSQVNECRKVSPAYTNRDYSALLYLNEDFEGGDFIFTEMDGKTLTASVKPKCGRMVGFSSGGENPHGVRAVTRGQRCAVALWFTLDPDHRDLDMLVAHKIVKSLDQWEQEWNLNLRDEL